MGGGLLMHVYPFAFLLKTVAADTADASALL